METMQKTYPGGVCSRLNPNEAVTSTNEYIYARIKAIAIYILVL